MINWFTRTKLPPRIALHGVEFAPTFFEDRQARKSFE